MIFSAEEQRELSRFISDELVLMSDGDPAPLTQLVIVLLENLADPSTSRAFDAAHARVVDELLPFVGEQPAFATKLLRAVASKSYLKRGGGSSGGGNGGSGGAAGGRDRSRSRSRERDRDRGRSRSRSRSRDRSSGRGGGGGSGGGGGGGSGAGRRGDRDGPSSGRFDSRRGDDRRGGDGRRDRYTDDRAGSGRSSGPILPAPAGPAAAAAAAELHRPPPLMPPPGSGHGQGHYPGYDSHRPAALAYGVYHPPPLPPGPAPGPAPAPAPAHPAYHAPPPAYGSSAAAAAAASTGGWGVGAVADEVPSTTAIPDIYNEAAAHQQYGGDRYGSGGGGGGGGDRQWQNRQQGDRDRGRAGGIGGGGGGDRDRDRAGGGSGSGPKRTIKVHGLSGDNASVAPVSAYFSKYGVVSQVLFVARKGEAFVQFRTGDAAAAALKDAHAGAAVMGDPSIQLTWAAHEPHAPDDLPEAVKREVEADAADSGRRAGGYSSGGGGGYGRPAAAASAAAAATSPAPGKLAPVDAARRVLDSRADQMAQLKESIEAQKGMMARLQAAKAELASGSGTITKEGLAEMLAQVKAQAESIKKQQEALKAAVNTAKIAVSSFSAKPGAGASGGSGGAGAAAHHHHHGHHHHGHHHHVPFASPRTHSSAARSPISPDGGFAAAAAAGNGGAASGAGGGAGGEGATAAEGAAEGAEAAVEEREINLDGDGGVEITVDEDDGDGVAVGSVSV